MQSKDLEVFNQMPFFFCIKDEGGRYIWVNKALNDKAGEDLTGKTDMELPWAHDSEKLIEDDRKVFEMGEPMFVHESIEKPEKITLSVSSSWGITKARDAYSTCRTL